MSDDGLLADAPWPYLLVKQAAKSLGVDQELVTGIAGTPKLRAVKSRGRTGQDVLLVCREDVQRLKAEMTQRKDKA